MMKQILVMMGKGLDASFTNGHAKFFSLLKRAGQMVVGDTIVTDALISYKGKINPLPSSISISSARY